MRASLAFWIPFGDLMHGEQAPGGPVWSQCVARQAWWHERAETLRRWTLPSIKHQICPEYVIAGGVATETPKAYDVPVMKALVDSGGMVYRHSAIDTINRGQCAPTAFVKYLFEHTHHDYVIVFWIDSDDAIALDVATMLHNIQPEDGLTAVMRRGYALDTITGRMFVYDPEKSPPPFFARWYRRNQFMEDPIEYEKSRQFHLFHHEMHRVKRKINLPDHRYLVTIHDSNTSSSMYGARTQCKLREEIVPARRDRILSTFGLHWEQ